MAAISSLPICAEYRRYWETYKVFYRYRGTTYNISILQIHNSDAEFSLSVDGIKNNNKFISLVDDRQLHMVEVRIMQSDSSE